MDLLSVMAGYALLAFFFTGAAYIAVMLLSTAVATIALSGAWRLRKRPWLMWPLLILFIYNVWFLFINRPSAVADDPSSVGYFKQENYQQQDTILAACAKAQLALPEQFVVENVVDEVTNTDYYQLGNLLAKRKLKFIELRVKNSAMGPLIVQGNGSPRGHWLTDKPINSYVKVAMGSPGDATCIPQEQIPDGLENGFYPLKKVCVTMTYLDRPTARYALDYVQDDPSNKDKTGQYRLVDRQSNITLAQLPTFDNPKRPTVRHPVPCRSPHSILLEKLVGN